ncbi:MAG: extracellular solute-binding protein, partial [Firmicutes bacterium]|nr:extracellular solute-binding protein [Bacillota bacterium]
KMTQQHIKIPTTWQQFEKETAKIVTPNQWAISINPTDMGAELAIVMTRSFGGKLVKNNQPNFNTPAAIKAMNLMKSLENSGAMKLGSGYPGDEAFGSDHALFHLTTTDGYYYDYEADGGKFTIGTAVLPTGSHGQNGNIIGGDDLAIFSQASTAQKQAAWTFLKWLSEPKQTAYWATHTGYLPVNKQAVPLMKKYLATHQYKEIGIKELKTATPGTRAANWSEAEHDWAVALQEVLVGKESPQTALAAAQGQAKTAMAGS